jgi:hypothetical protein
VTDRSTMVKMKIVAVEVKVEAQVVLTHMILR